MWQYGMQDAVACPLVSVCMCVCECFSLVVLATCENADLGLVNGER